MKDESSSPHQIRMVSKETSMENLDNESKQSKEKKLNELYLESDKFSLTLNQE